MERKNLIERINVYANELIGNKKEYVLSNPFSYGNSIASKLTLTISGNIALLTKDNRVCAYVTSMKIADLHTLVYKLENECKYATNDIKSNYIVTYTINDMEFERTFKGVSSKTDQLATLIEKTKQEIIQSIQKLPYKKPTYVFSCETKCDFVREEYCYTVEERNINYHQTTTYKTKEECYKAMRDNIHTNIADLMVQGNSVAVNCEEDTISVYVNCKFVLKGVIVKKEKRVKVF